MGDEMVMYLDKFVPIEIDVMNTMLDLAQIKPGEKHIDLGSGDGRFVVEAMKRGAKSIGYEIDQELVNQSITEHGITVFNQDCFEADVSQADVITCWFSKLPETEFLVDKLYKEMKVGAKLIKAARTDHKWKPIKTFMKRRHWICLYIK